MENNRQICKLLEGNMIYGFSFLKHAHSSVHACILWSASLFICFFCFVHRPVFLLEWSRWSKKRFFGSFFPWFGASLVDWSSPLLNIEEIRKQRSVFYCCLWTTLCQSSTTCQLKTLITSLRWHSRLSVPQDHDGTSKTEWILPFRQLLQSVSQKCGKVNISIMFLFYCFSSLHTSYFILGPFGIHLLKFTLPTPVRACVRLYISKLHAVPMF